MRPNLRILAAVAFALVAATSHVEAKRHAVTSGQWGGVSFEIPDGWTARTQGREQAGGTALRVVPPAGTPLVLLLTPLPMGAAADPREAVTSIARTVQTQLSEVAVEKELPIRELRGPRAEGRFVSATDRTVETPTADNYRFVDQGAVVTGRFLVSFTLLTNDPDGPSRASAREIVASASHVLPGPPWRNPDGTIAMAFPGKSWRVRIALPGFDVEPLAPKQSEPGVRMLARNAKSGVIVSAYLERSPEGWTAVRHREDALVKMQAADGMKRDKVRRSERADAAILEYEVAAYRGERIDQKSMNAYLVRDGVWIDVHVSKTAFKPEDQPLLDAVIDSVRIEE